MGLDRPRAHWAVAAAALVIVVATTAAVGLRDGAPTARTVSPGVGAVSATGSPTGRGLAVGLDYGDTLVSESASQLNTSLNDAVFVGAQWIRVDLSWADTQPASAPVYNWENFDRIVTGANERGLKILATVGYTPAWARPADCKSSQNCAPANPQAFAAFVKQAVRRYAPEGLHTWEIWNEPNIGFWLPHPDAAAYVKLLSATAGAIRSSDRKAFIVLGGLAAVQTNPAKNWTGTYEYLQQVAQLGGNKLVDAIGYHPYTFPYLPTTARPGGNTFQWISQVPDSLASLLKTYGTPNLPIWITETGAPTASGRSGPVSAENDVIAGSTMVTDAYQADFAQATMTAVLENPDVGSMFWFSDQDQPSQQLYFGLRNADGSIKPSYYALKAAISAYRQDAGQ